MTRLRRQRGGTLLFLALGLLVLVPSAASAHTGAGPAHGLLHGLTHPFLGWDHVLAMIAVGLLAGQRGGRAVWALPLAFVAAVVAGGAAAMAGLQVTGIEAGIVASLVVLGALVALAVRFPLAAGMTAVAAFALFHGHAHGAEMPATSGLFYGLGFAASTAMLHALGIAVVAAARTGAVVAAARARAGTRSGVLTDGAVGQAAARQPVLVRVAGAAISFAGLGLWLVG